MVLALLRTNMFSFRDIARREKVSQQTVSRISRVGINNKEQGEIHILEIALRSRSYEGNSRSGRPAKKPKLTAKVKKARQEFTRHYRHYIVEAWKTVMVL